jgi:signal transduction histidine kinase
MMNLLVDFTWARLGGGIPVELGPVDFGAICASAAAEVKAGHPHLVVESHGEASGQGDPARIAQVFTNLIENAAKYGRAGAPITVRLREREGCGPEIDVHNEGAPIPADLQPRIFDPFVRGTGDSTRRSLGLGLYIVREIVRAHGGEIEISSTVEAGTTFRVRLPRRCGSPPFPRTSTGAILPPPAEQCVGRRPGPRATPTA